MPDPGRDPDRSTTGVVLVAFRSGPDVPVRAAELRSAGFQVCVVDNAAEYEAADVLHPGRNLGFGGACNLAESTFPETVTVLVLHNPDVECSAAEIDSLVGELRGQGSPGLVAAAEVHPGGAVRSGYRYPTPVRELLLALRSRVPALRAVLTRPGPSGTPTAVESRHLFGSAALMAVDRARFDRIGGFDDRYFLYAEDLDLWETTRRSGGDVSVSTLAVGHHVGTGSDASSHRRELLRWLGVELFLEKYPERGSWRRTRLAHRLALVASGSAKDDVERAVRAHWRAGERPSDVQGLLRSVLASGTVPADGERVAGVDVVVTCCDYGRFLEAAVDSAFAQSRAPVSVTVIDDASVDATPLVLGMLHERYPGLRSRRLEPRRGVATARNVGMAMGQAEYVCFLDADDVLPATYLEALSSALDAGSCDIAVAPLRPFGPGAATVRVVAGFDPEMQVTDNLINASALFPRSLVDRVGGFAPVLDRLGYEDWDLWLRMMAAGARVEWVGETWLEYRRHGAVTRNPVVGARRLLARAAVWWRSRSLVRVRHVRRWLESLVSRGIKRWTDSS